VSFHVLSGGVQGFSPCRHLSQQEFHHLVFIFVGWSCNYSLVACVSKENHFLTPNVQCLWVRDHFWPPNVQCFWPPVVITISFLQRVLTLWYLVSERSLDLFFFRMLAANWLTDSDCFKSSQSQSHIATDSQSVSLSIEPHLGPMTRYLFLSDSYVLVRFEVSTAVTMMIIIFWEMTPCGSHKLRSVTYSHSCTLKMEAKRSSETSVLIRATRCHLPEDDNHQLRSCFRWAPSLRGERVTFVCAAGPCQRSLSRVLVPWDLRLYFTVSDLRLPFSSPPTTRRLTLFMSEYSLNPVFVYRIEYTLWQGSRLPC
jgi:hypothetical protein